MPLALSTPAILTAQTTIGYANDHTSGTGCVPAAGPDRYYSLTIPAGLKLSVTVTPTSSWNPSVSIISTVGCSSSSPCLASSDAAGTGAAEFVQYQNSIPAPLSVYVVVDSASGSEAGTFTLEATVTSP